MSTLLISHPACLDHLTPMGHPERPDRLRAIEQALEDERFQTLAREQAPRASLETVALVHPMDYIEAIADASPSEGMVQLDADTSMSPGSYEAALRAAGGGMLAVDEVMAGKAANAFVATRPPGHHTETARPMGFCLFNNAAIAARYAQKKYGAERAAIVDFDVHHGNGSQDIFWSDKTVMYCSTHEMPLYPGTGALSERGTFNNIVNAPLSAGDGGDAFREAFETAILPRLREFKPDILVISAGFDAHTRDPLANLNLVEADYTWVTRKLMEIADGSANGRIVSML
jgi:acetoin utilization deacetylase AcuC-like enzyme